MTTVPDREPGAAPTLLASVPDVASPADRAPRARSAGERALPVLFGVDLVTSAIATALLVGGPAALCLPVAWTGLLALGGCYARRRWPRDTPGLHTVTRVALVLLLLVEVCGSQLDSFPRPGLVAWLAVSGGAALVLRSLVRVRSGHELLRGLLAPRRVVLVGDARAVERTLAELSGDGGPVLVVAVCVLDDDALDVDVPVGRGHESLRSLVARHHAEAVLAVPCRQVTPRLIRWLAWDLERTHAELLVWPGLPHLAPGRVTVALAGSVPVLHVRAARLRGTARLVKDVWERLAAGTLLVVLAPVLLLLMVAIRLDSPGGPIFRQVRVGRDERPFVLYKLRTMATGADQCLAAVGELNEADGALFKVRADPRVTRLGAVLRRWSLDELPQLWNVVKGQMSLVGPRPPLPAEVAAYEDEVHRRMVVRPGLTGLWQVSGRSDLSWRQAVHLDLFYVDNWSLALDLSIVWRTFRAVLAREGAY